MDNLVVDSSVAVKWFVVEPYSTEACRILDAYQNGLLSFLAPDLINAEFGNIIWKKHLFQGLAASDAQDILDKMQNLHPDLGELRSTHRPAIFGILLFGLVLIPFILVVIASVFFTFNTFVSLFTENKGSLFDAVGKFLICLVAPSLILTLAGGFWLSDVRKWLKTRTVKLRIYQNGFTYESQGQTQACRWSEIKNINFRFIEISSKVVPRRKVKVIRSVDKTDGQVINIAETLNLIKITEIIKSASGK
ncbi:MAG: hypothetical protein H7Y30_16715 [Pyrinomonadaceae bacterium]|nr:hypothetical protein [Pyrinomonadaceae bacterium]